MTIYSPFSPAYRRTKIYYLVSVVGPLIVILMIWQIQEAQQADGENECLEFAYTS